MKLSIYLAEDRIQVVLGKPGKRLKIKDCHSYDLKPGTLINDVVIDEDDIKDVLAQIGNQYDKYSHKVHLMLGGSQIMTKVLQVPPMSKRLLLDLTKKEMKNFSGAGENTVYDYSVIRRKNADNKGGTILCAAMDRASIEYYEKLFAACGMKLEAIDIALNAMAQMAENLPFLAGKTYIISIMDGRNMLSALYVGGAYNYTSRQRLLSERDSENIIEEQTRAIASIVQFNKAQKTDHEIESVYFCGLSAQEEEALFPSIQTAVAIPAKRLEDNGKCFVEKDCNYRMSDYIYATGNLFGR